MCTGLQAQRANSRLDEYGTRTLVVGALGVIGRNVVEHLADTGRSVVGLSRRRPPLAAGTGAEHLLADVMDPGTGVRLRDSLHDVTHLVFAAYQEQSSLAGQVAPNLNLLEGSLDALAAAGATLQHVILYQGNKYYGAHLGPFKTPAREDDPRLLGPNFYYDQEDLLRLRAQRDGFAFTIFRPEAVCGVATGNPMNLLTAIAVYATLCKHKNIPLRFPGPEQAADVLYQVTDARLLARATAWAGLAESARDQDFNITNGDTFRWRHMFPRTRPTNAPHRSHAEPGEGLGGDRFAASPRTDSLLRTCGLGICGLHLPQHLGQRFVHDQNPAGRLPGLHRQRAHVHRTLRHPG
jgi:nucleoside-diphosphate-sugar epimerase